MKQASAAGQKNEKQRFDVRLTKGDISIEPKPVDTGGRSATDAWYYVGFVGQIGFTVAIPIAAGALIGSYLDSQWSTYPRMTLGLLLLGVVISVVAFIRTVIDIINRKN